jgi:hypothetical protein
MAKATEGVSDLLKSHKGEMPESINISCAANGYTVDVRYAGRKKKGQEFPSYSGPEHYVFSTRKETAEFVEYALGSEDDD